MQLRPCISGLLALLLIAGGSAAAAANKTRNVVLLVADGLRPEEVFTGAENALLNEKIGGSWWPEGRLRKRYWDADPGKRRRLLLPFIWGTVAREGQLLGNAQLGSSAQVTNPYAISYPGYSEMSTGVADVRINSNEYGPNPNVSVFEYLTGKPGYAGKVGMFGGWEKFHDIFNEQRSHLLVRTGASLTDSSDNSPRGQLLQQLSLTTTRLEPDDPLDSFVGVSVLDYLQDHRPRVLFVDYGDTDNWAHMGRYDLVLEAAHGFDAFVEALWNRMQSLPEYKDQTTFIITADHGRGHGQTGWKEHGHEYPGSENIWIAIIGPDTPARGERHHIAAVKQAQIAATIAALLGEDFRSTVPKAAPPFLDLLTAP